MVSAMKFGILGVAVLVISLTWFGASDLVSAAHDATASTTNELVDPNCRAVSEHETHDFDDNSSSAYFIDHEHSEEESIGDPTCRGTCVKWGLHPVHLGYRCLKTVWKCYYYG